MSTASSSKLTITLNGIEHEVLNCSTAEEMETKEMLMLRDPQGYESIYKTPYGRTKDYEESLRRTGLSRYVIQHTFENFTTEKPWQKAVKDKAMDFVENPQGWFLISGQSGSGKTHICNAIAISLLRKGKRLRHMLWLEEATRMKFDMQNNSENVHKFITPDVLYIDDFLKTRGDTEPSDAEIEIAYQIIDGRYRDNKTTIISTEKSMQQIQSYDSAVHGRLMEMSRNNILQITRDKDKNYRIQRGQM